MKFKELLEISGMSQTAFANYFEIPLRTVQNWCAGVRECPTYLMKLIKYKLEKEKKRG
jgi:DNA-binding transcriptional regulator YiaG